MPFTELINTLSRYETPNQAFLDKYAIYTPETLRNGECNRIFTVNDLDQLESPYLSHILPVETIPRICSLGNVAEVPIPMFFLSVSFGRT